MERRAFLGRPLSSGRPHAGYCSQFVRRVVKKIPPCFVSELGTTLTEPIRRLLVWSSKNCLRPIPYFLGVVEREEFAKRTRRRSSATVRYRVSLLIQGMAKGFRGVVRQTAVRALVVWFSFFQRTNADALLTLTHHYAGSSRKIDKNPGADELPPDVKREVAAHEFGRTRASTLAAKQSEFLFSCRLLFREAVSGRGGVMRRSRVAQREELCSDSLTVDFRNSKDLVP